MQRLRRALEMGGQIRQIDLVVNSARLPRSNCGVDEGAQAVFLQIHGRACMLDDGHQSLPVRAFGRGVMCSGCLGL
jgi:hypothetical protein